MWEALEVLVRIVQIITLFIVSGTFIVVVMIGIYLASEEIRDIVYDFQDWAERFLMKRRFRTIEKTVETPYMAMIEYVKTDTRMVLEMYDLEGHKHGSLYDAVAADHQIDPARRDIQTIERATEYRNGIS